MRVTCTMIEQFPMLRNLPVAQKLALATELWDDVERDEKDVSDVILQELDRRMEHFERNPDAFTTWEAIKARLLKPRRE